MCAYIYVYIIYIYIHANTYVHSVLFPCINMYLINFYFFRPANVETVDVPNMVVAM